MQGWKALSPENSLDNMAAVVMFCPTDMKPEQIKKYKPFKTVELKDRQWPDQSITSAPIWASVDLRDGNQSLPTPMNIEEKLEYFDLLVRIGFKQIEVGFPSASDTEYNSYAASSRRTSSLKT